MGRRGRALAGERSEERGGERRLRESGQRAERDCGEQIGVSEEQKDRYNMLEYAERPVCPVPASI